MQHDSTQLIWRKSSYSSGNGQCLEVCDGIQEVTPVRDSKSDRGPLLVFRDRSWSAFLTAVKANSFYRSA
ncbi:DUF397 domain-containing protein [Streptomyces sp. NBC_00053]|uniref:DUF397 domain-containing protein n=1 Tax=unclassified Streptomyces TaxID=2593676 RepID=UPI00225A8293|nr:MULTISPECIES: DUF397 domain-containing protein [unclassified Streptomyces]WSG51860.1 DUF397 domain-containing protein [Streptomyces sp. NBC_01732]MCX5101802.1 DUF397 domain-containing protein [Streptomyces sp. NBC_00439]MCX5501595.1 DUF397 domain-containing protein [Streptomyces sp. NBC_00052]MCX5549870.1 DUF397 domain-containing protein [Streptomyces sp. NBC_00051]WSC29167.1 DUF397 domain-containing protein [Streptomyces sp. NBC_01768]